MNKIETFTTPEHGWLSNMWPCRVVFDHVTYDSIENAYVAAKTLDKDIREKVRLLSPYKAKTFGRTFALRSDWEYIKIDVMRYLIHQKFSELNPKLKDQLIATDGIELQEGNGWGDLFWGVDMITKKGTNMLGNLLMERRDELLGKPFFNEEE